MRIGAFDYFAVHFQDHAQHTMCGWMLRPEVQGVVANFRHALFRLFPGHGFIRFLNYLHEVNRINTAGTYDFRHQHARFDTDRLINHAPLFGIIDYFDVATQREILAERMADETVIRQQTAQGRIAGKEVSIQVKGLAGGPGGSGPATLR